jgi:hypothetical protein
MKPQYYGSKTSKGAACFHNFRDPSNDFVAGDPRYVFKIVGDKVTFLYEDGHEENAHYSRSSVQSHPAWMKFVRNPFEPAKTYKRAANGRFAADGAAKGTVRPENVVKGRKYSNAGHPGVEYMGVGEPARMVVINAPEKKWTNGNFVVDYKTNPDFWDGFIGLTEAGK